MSGWRTGGHPVDEPGPRQRTIYGPDGELRGVMFTTADAAMVVAALNEAARRLLHELESGAMVTFYDRRDERREVEAVEPAEPSAP